MKTAIMLKEYSFMQTKADYRTVRLLLSKTLVVQEKGEV